MKGLKIIRDKHNPKYFHSNNWLLDETEATPGRPHYPAVRCSNKLLVSFDAGSELSIPIGTNFDNKDLAQQLLRYVKRIYNKNNRRDLVIHFIGQYIKMRDCYDP